MFIGKSETMSSRSHRCRPSFDGLTTKEAKAPDNNIYFKCPTSEAVSQEVFRPAELHVFGVFTLSLTYGNSSTTSKVVNS